MKNRHFSLRAWLLCLSLLATLPLLAFSLSVVWEHKNFQQQVVIDRLTHRSDELAQRVSQEVESVVGVLVSLAESDMALSLNVPGLYAQAQRVVKRQPGVHAITLANRTKIVFLTRAPLHQTGWPVNAPKLVADALVTRVPNASGPFASPLGPNKVVAVTVPILNGAAPTHVLRAIVTVESLNQLLASSDLPDGWIAGIGDRNGTLLARTHDPEQYVGQQTSASFLKAISTGETRAFEGATVEGIPTMNRLRPVFGLDWYLGLAVPMSVLHAPVTAMLWYTAGLAVLWVGLAGALAVVFSHHVTRQMRTVATAMVDGVDALPERAPVRVTELLGMFQQFATAKRNELAAGRRYNEVQDLYDNAPCGYHSLDADGRVTRMNKTELNWLGLTLPEVLGRRMVEFLSPASQETFHRSFPVFLQQGHIDGLVLELVPRSGPTRFVLVSATAVYDTHGRVVASRSTVSDHTASQRLETELLHLAQTDALTGLSNRRDFTARAQQEMARCARSGDVFHVLMLDIDFFKRVNDEHGHAAGDEVLREVARTLQSTLRSLNTPARLGGEEFAVLVPQASPGDVVGLAERVRTMLEASPVPWNGVQIAFTVSIGVAQWCPGETIEATLDRADKALYEAKHTGRNRVCASQEMT